MSQFKDPHTILTNQRLSIDSKNEPLHWRYFSDFLSHQEHLQGLSTVKPQKWLVLGPVKKPSFAKTVIFKLLLDSYRKTVILRGLRWPLNVICKEWELNANRHLARSVTCEAFICEVLLYIVIFTDEFCDGFPHNLMPTPGYWIECSRAISNQGSAWTNEERDLQEIDEGITDSPDGSLRDAATATEFDPSVPRYSVLDD